LSEMKYWDTWETMSKNNKIRIIILEGETDTIFFNAFKKEFDRKMWDISTIDAKNLNFPKIKREIKASLKVLNYKEVWLVMDLKTQKKKTIKDYSSREEMVADYKKNLENPGMVDYIVIVRDLECWLLLYFSRHKNTQTVKDSKKELNGLMEKQKTITKIAIAQRLTKKKDFWDKLVQNKDKNESFRDFFAKAIPD
jgi:hypothetical protein